MLMGYSVSLPVFCSIVLLFYCSVVNGNMYDHCSMLVCLYVRAFVLHATIREKGVNVREKSGKNQGKRVWIFGRHPVLNEPF